MSGRGDSRTITAAELVNAPQLTLFDYVLAERPHWLRSDGVPLRVTVYVNESLIGGPSVLRDLTLANVATARFLELSAAQQRYNSARLPGPVIAVTTK